jgi:hypothetical protein
MSILRKAWSAVLFPVWLVFFFLLLAVARREGEAWTDEDFE